MAEIGVWIGKYILCITNFVFFIGGTIAIGAGIWLLVDRSSLVALFKPVESEFVQEFSDVYLITDLTYVLLVVGVIMFLLGLIAYCGVMHESRCLIILYAVLTSLLLLGEVIALCYAGFYHSEVKSEAKNYWQKSISNFYAGNNHQDGHTIMWNRMMSTYSCCGIDSYQDFERSTAWLTQRTNGTKIPAACCILSDIANIVPQDPNCVFDPRENNSYYQNGCYDRIELEMDKSRYLIIGILVGLLAMQLLLICIACFLTKAFSKYDDLRL